MARAKIEEFSCCENKSNARSTRFVFNYNEVFTPLIIPSISSARDPMVDFNDILKFLKDAPSGSFLTSLYDLGPSNLEQYEDTNYVTTAFADSGGFELRMAYNQNRIQYTKKWEFKTYLRLAEITNPDVLMSYDPPHLSDEEKLDYAGKTVAAIRKWNAEKEYQTMFEYIFSGLVVEENKTRSKNLRMIKKMIDQVMKLVSPEIIGIPNQCLGSTIPERSWYIAEIVKHMRKKYPMLMLHILGCGDPQEILAYIRVGADIFDSTTWYRNYIDNRMKYYDELEVIPGFQFFENCPCRFCEHAHPDDEHLFGTFLRHNLEAYRDFTWDVNNEIIHQCVKKGDHKCSD